MKIRTLSALIWYFAALILLITLPYAGWIEGWIFPVVDYRKTFITKYLEKDEGEQTIISGLFRKERDCAFQTMRFYQRDGTKIDARRNGYISSNRPGRLPFGPWAVNAPAQLVLCDSYVIAEHTCHRLWSTYSLFYDGLISQNPLCDTKGNQNGR